MTFTIVEGDCLEAMRALEPNSVDSIVCDPPYGLEFMGVAWDSFTDRPKGTARTRNTWGDFGSREHPRHSFEQARILRNKSVALYDFSLSWAVEALRVAKPGAFLAAFGGTRTEHRLTCALEDAGWEIRDKLCWLHGQGFPKSLNVSKAFDKAVGAEREVVGRRTDRAATPTADMRGGRFVGSIAGAFDGSAITAPATDLAREWDGWGTALKPAWEGAILARKPLDGDAERDIIVANLCQIEAQLWSLLPAKTAAESFGLSPAEHGAACAFAQWIADEQNSTRAALSDLMATSLFVSAMTTSLNTVSSWRAFLGDLCSPRNTSTTGAKDSSPSLTTDLRILASCLSGLTPLSIIRAAMSQPGSTLSALPAAKAFDAVALKWQAILTLSALEAAISPARTLLPAEGDLSPAYEPIVLARKPLNGTVIRNVERYGTGALNIDACRIGTTDRWEPTGHQSPPSTVGFSRTPDRQTSTTHPNGRWPANVVLDEAGAAALDQQSGVSTSSGGRSGHTAAYQGGFKREYYGDASPGFGDTGGASRFFYCAKSSPSERSHGLQGERNIHPTCKPVKLMEWLITLVTPPGGLVLDPFLGSGSTGVAAVHLGFDFLGLEREHQYVEIARRRIEHAAGALVTA